MSSKELYQLLKDNLQTKDCDDPSKFVIQYKNEGGDQQSAKETVYRLLDELEEGSDWDLIAEVADCVTGWCSPKYRVWP